MSEVNSSVADVAQQAANGVQTGFEKANLSELLGNLAAGWREAERLDVLLLRALCALSREQPEAATQGFSALELATTVTKLTATQRWASVTDKSEASDKVRIQWANLVETTWPAKQEGVLQHARFQHWPLVPSLAKTEGGGTGNVSRYRLAWAETPESESMPVSLPSSSAVTDKQSINYICEDVRTPNPLVRVFAKGYFMAGWRRWLFILLLGIPMLMLLAASVLVLYRLVRVEAFGLAGATGTLVSFLILMAAFMPTLIPLLNVAQRKIVVAPWWLQSVHDDRLLEHRCKPLYETRTLKIVRYTAVCPLCQGEMTAKSGGFDFFGRLVGRCENSPQEHVYSFDHVTRTGRSLR